MSCSNHDVNVVNDIQGMSASLEHDLPSSFTYFFMDLLSNKLLWFGFRCGSY